MDFEVYCDESRPELLSSSRPGQARYTLIGGLWMPADLRPDFKGNWQTVKAKHHRFEELKWTKISRSSVGCYEAAVDIFLQSENLRFRCIAIDSTRLDVDRYHEGDPELGFFKFYYWLLDAWTYGPDAFFIFCDIKTTRLGGRLSTLQRCLNRSVHLRAPVANIQAIPSSQSAGLQLTDILLGVAGARLNSVLDPGSAKESVATHLERGLGISQICDTPKSEAKFNVFKIRLR
jgi:hypothetical protein